MEISESLLLDKIKLGDSCYIKGLLGFDDNNIKRMLDLGFVNDTRVIPLYKSIIGNTVAYLVKGSIIALRQKDAKKILVSFRR